MAHSLPLRKLFFTACFFMLTALSPAAQSYQWAHALGGTLGEVVNASITDNDHNVYICGSFAGRADFDPSSDSAILEETGSMDIFIAKYDKNGKHLWSVSMGGNDIDAAYALATDRDNNVFVTGVFRGTVDFDPSSSVASLSSSGSTDIFLCKFRHDGRLLWANKIGGTKFDEGQSIGTDSAGNVYITGNFTDMCAFDPSGIADPLISNGASDIFFAKYDKNGQYVWAKNVGEQVYDFGVRIFVNPGGNFYLSGNFSGDVDFDPGNAFEPLGSDGISNIFLASYDKNGHYIWAKKLGGVSSENVTGLAGDPSGKVYICGDFQNRADFDPSEDSAFLESKGESDIFIAAYNKDGDYLWAGSAGGTDEDKAKGIAVHHNRIYIGGYFRGTTDLQPGTGTSSFISSGESDMFISVYDTSGRYIMSKQVGGTDYDFAQTITTDTEGNIYLSGYFRGTADMDPSTDTKLLTVAGQADVFLAKYAAEDNNTSAQAPQANPLNTCYPNPSSGEFYIHCKQSGPFVFASIYNVHGLLIDRKKLDEPVTLITLDDAPSGLYLVSISDGINIQSSHVLIKQ